MLKKLSRQEGQQLIQLALLLPILFAALGLVVDVGLAYVRHQKVQGSADAAASAAAMVLYDKGRNVAMSTALYYAAQQGYDNDGVNNTVQVFNPPNSGAYAGNAQYIQVKIQDNVSPYFASLLWDGQFHVRSTAVAGWSLTGMGAPVIVLEENACQTLRMTGSTILRVLEGNIHVNSHCSDAVRIVGSAMITTQTPMTIVGGFSAVGSIVVNPAPITGAAVLPDPLRNLPAPDFDAYPVQHGTASKPQTYHITGSKSVTLDPGVYYGGIKATGSTSLTLNPGVYIMAGGGFVMTGSSSIQGDGVMIYVSEDPDKPSGDGQAGPMDFAGSGTVNLSAPETGTYAGILYFQDRDNTEGAHFTGSSVVGGLNGIIYIANGELTMTGSSNVEANFVVNELTMTGSTVFTVAGYDGPGWTTVTSSLVE